MIYFLITKDSIETNFIVTIDSKFRSIEHYLTQHKIKFEFDSTTKIMQVSVSSEAEAHRLCEELQLKEITLNYEGKISLISAQRTRRIKNRAMVTDSSLTKPLTLAKYTKLKKAETLSQAEIVKRGIMTKTELAKALASTKIKIVSFGTQSRITKESLYSYLGGQ